MIILNVFFKVKPEQKQNFIQTLTNMVQESRKEAGCQLYQLGTDILDANSFLLIEHWVDEAAIAAHNQTPHWNHLVEVIGDYLAQPFVIEKYQA
ncbi:putative quinol monooxygenase [Acinetobacter sp. ANC 5383]